MSVRLLPDFEAAFAAVRRVEQLLQRATDALNASGVPYAVIGANAVAAWVSTVDPGATRSTKDVDILARRETLPALSNALKSIGLASVDVFGVMVFVERIHPTPKRAVRVAYAGERIRPEYRYAAPDLESAVHTIAPYPVVDLPSLVAMKLQALRLIDRVHLVDLKGVGLITDDLAAKLPPDLRERLKRIPEPDTH